MSTDGTITSPSAIREHFAIMKHYPKELEAVLPDAVLPFRENQCADAAFAEGDIVNFCQRLAATVVFEHNNPRAPKIKLL